MQSKYDRPQLCGKDVTPQEQETLVRLMEECGEMIQAASKVLRWGWLSRNPDEVDGPTNRERLFTEYNDMKALAGRLGFYSPLPINDLWAPHKTAAPAVPEEKR